MSDFELGLEGLKLCAAVALFAASYYFVYRRARMDGYRQDLFTLRNQLWDFAESCGMLHHQAHRRIRRTINGFIRIAPVMEPLWGFAVAKLTPSVLSAIEPIEKVLDRIVDPEVKNGFAMLERKVKERAVNHLLFGSISGLVVTSIGVVLALLFVIPPQLVRGFHRASVANWTAFKASVRRRLAAWRADIAKQAEARAYQLDRAETIREHEMSGCSMTGVL